LALVLTASGLFSLLSHLVAQQTKEIGVRVTLGASTRTVAQVVLTQALRPAAVGLITGAGLAAGMAIVLKAVPAASELHDWIQVFDPVAYATSVMVIATSCVVAVSVPAFRAARLDPIDALRTDT
jgi:putative ABC transport system permease protein